MKGMESIRLQLRGLRCFRMNDKSGLWLEVETVSQTEKLGSEQEIPARRSTTLFSLSQFLWLRTCEMCTVSKSLSMRMTSVIAVQKEAVLCSVL